MKHIFYDWFGLNKTLFVTLNSALSADFIRPLAYFANDLCKHDVYAIPYITLIILVIMYIYKYSEVEYFINMSIKLLETLSILCIVLFVGFAAIIAIKLLFSYPRPFCSNLQDINVIEDIAKSYRCKSSFPSGHTGFAVMFTISIWHWLNNKFKILFLFLNIYVGLSRIVAGVHFPADVIISAIISISLGVPIKILLHNFIYSNIDTLKNQLAKWQNILQKFTI